MIRRYLNGPLKYLRAITSMPLRLIFTLWYLIIHLRRLRITLSFGWVVVIVMTIGLLVVAGIFLDTEYNDSAIIEWLRTTQHGTVSQEVESGSTTIRNIGLAIAATVALIIAVWRGQVAEAQNEVSRQDLMNERYQKGAEMLGHKVLAVRLAGISALQRLAEEDRQQYYVQVMRSLCAFAQHPTPGQNIMMGIYWDEQGEHHYHPLRGDVQAIMSVLGSRNKKLIAFEEEQSFRIDLSEANLTSADLRELNLSTAILSSAIVPGSDLRGTDLSGADLMSTALNDALLQGAILSNTTFVSTNLSDAVFSEKAYGSHREKISAHGLKQVQLNSAFYEPGRPPDFGDMMDPETGHPLRVNRVQSFPDD